MPHPIRHTKAMASTTELSVHTKRLWNFAEDSTPHFCAPQTTQLQTPGIDVENFSTWRRLLDSTRMVFMAIRDFKTKLQTRRPNKSPEISNTDNFASDENKTRNYLIKMSMSEIFSGKISSRLKGSNLKNGDKQMPFTPFLGDIELGRVGGRLNKAPLYYNMKLPLLLLSRSRIARLLIEKAHLDCGHQVVKYMRAHLPNFRFPDVNNQYSLVNTSIYMFGPFYIEDKREGTQMYYVLLFTCLATGVVQLEVCHDFSTDCLLMAIRRFVSRHGYPDLIVSDNGKNFIGDTQAMKLIFQRNYNRNNDYKRNNEWIP